MNRYKKKSTAYVSAALLLGLLLSLGRAVSIPARSAPGSPFFTVSVNTLSADALTPISANILRRSLSGNRPDTGEDPESSWTARSYKECSITLPADAAQAFAGEIALPVDMAMAETASVVFLHAPLIVSVKETAPVAATFSESLVFRSCAAEEKNATDNQLHLNRPAQTAYMERRNGPTHDFTLFPEDYRNSRYRRG